MSISTPKPVNVLIDDIGIGDRRTADPERVQHYRASIEKVGLLNPIGLNRDKRLIHGLHRLEACKLLGWKKIPALIHNLDELHAELAEIDENLVRSDLGAMELGEALVRRKEIYEQLHPETKHGGDRKSKAAKSSGSNCHLIAFAEEAARKMGRSARTVRWYMTVAERIPHDLRKQLRTTDIGKKISELEELSKLPKTDQRAIVERIVRGARSVADGIKAIKGPRSPEMRKLMAAKQSTGGSGAKKGQSGDGVGPGPDTGDEAPEVKAPEEMPSKKAPATGDTCTEHTADPERSRMVEDDLPAQSPASGEHASEDDESRAVDLVAIYDDILEDLAEKTRFLEEHFTDVVGKSRDPNKAASVLAKAVDVLEDARALEAKRAAEAAQTGPTPCGA